MPEGFTVSASPPGLRPVQWLTPAGCAASDPRGYVVKGLIAPRDLALLFGPPGTGKSCLAPRLAYAVARGEPIFGRRVRPGPVLYIAAEDSHGMRARIAALRAELGDAPNLFMTGDLIGFMDRDSPAEAELRAKVAMVQPVLVIIDTIAAGFPGLRENESGDEGMGRVITFARGLIADSGAAVLLIHHAPKGDTSTPRGHGSLHGDADVALTLARDDGGLIRAVFTKNRNGPSDGALAFTIRTVTLGEDDDGDPITAPICEPADDTGPNGPRLRGQARTALGFLWDLIAREGKPLPPGPAFPSGSVRAVQEARWREECESRRLTAGDNTDTHARAFRRAFRDLRAKNRVACRDGWVWPIHEGMDP